MFDLRCQLSRLCILLTTLPLLNANATLSLAQDADVTVTPIGSPTWYMTGFQLFSAPGSTDEEFFGVIESIVGENAREVVTAPPYDNLIPNGVAANGYEVKNIFAWSEANERPNIPYFAFNIIPDGTVTGSSFDFDSGPIIPNALLPIKCDLKILREGEQVDFCGSELGRMIDGLDGDSHTGLFFAATPSFFPDGTELLGSYEFTGTLLDASGAGYQISAPYSVVPEPSVGVLMLFGLTALGSARVRRTPKAM